MTAAAHPRPAPGPRRPYRFPTFERTRLPNGIELVVVPVRRLPLVTIRLVLDTGARQEQRQEAGVGALAAAALAEGTTRLDSGALADEFEQLGGALMSYATWDSTHVRSTVLAGNFEKALRLLAEVVRTPAFNPREVDRLKEERLAELLELRSEPRGLADERFNSSLYKTTSRFSTQEAGSEKTVSLLTRDDCLAWHAQQFAPAVTALVVAGDVGIDEVVRVASSALGDWAARPPVESPVDDLPSVITTLTRFIDRSGAPQSELRLGHVGLRRNHPDYFNVAVMNAILGGVFNSRINMNLREKNAFTYGAFSSYEWRRDAAPFVVSTAVATAVTAPAIREILVELERMQQAPPNADELSLSTSYLDGVFPIRFETTDAIAGALASLLTLRLPDDYYDTYRDRVRAVTADDVLRAAQNHIHLDRLQVLAVGDREQVLPTLDGLALGPISIIGDDDE
jgi:zinc protease